MARYIVLRVESNSIADELLKRFSVVSAIKVVGLFAAVSKQCKCPEYKGRVIRSRKWGTVHCTECKMPRVSVMQHPRNLLQDEDLHPRYADFHLSVWEPFFNEPEEKYGEDAIERTKQQVRDAKERLSKSKRRKARKNNGG